MVEVTASGRECRVCGEARFVVFDTYAALPRITSDCRPFRSGGELRLCCSCGAVQKIATARWLAEIAEIYREYTPYYQSEGAEQAVFDSHARRLRPRSEILIERLALAVPLREQGAVLDIGCGTGATLRALSGLLPGYRLYGQDLDRRNEKRLQAIPNFVELYTCNLRELTRRFDIATLIHALEHFPDPLELLRTVRDRLDECGVLLIEVCDVERNPFDLLIADHLMHFSARTLRRIVENAGFRVATVATDWVEKELSCVAQPASEVSREPDAREPTDIAATVSRNLDWLQRMIAIARQAAERYGNIGIFGTSIAGTWLAGSIPGGYGFFVDEDPNRIGRRHLGKPILAPHQIPENAAVVLALAPLVARTIRERLHHLPVVFIEPPAFD